MLPIFLLFFVFPLSASECPANSILWESYCYIFESVEIPFVTAEKNCLQNGGHLASVHDGFTNAFLAQQAGLNFTSSTVSDVWIGATNLIKAGNFSWTDDSNYDFKNWGKMDNITGQYCAGLNMLNGFWQCEDCFKGLRSCYGNLGMSTWTEAERTCNSVGAHLISIHTIEENNFVQSLENKAGHWLWIGGNVLIGMVMRMLYGVTEHRMTFHGLEICILAHHNV